MSRKEMPRMYELIDQMPTGLSLSAIFRDFDRLLNDGPDARKEFLSLETDLQELDAAVWDSLKMEVAPLLTRRQGPLEKDAGPPPEWPQLMDRIRSEVKGYVYLMGIGCKEIRLIPPDPKRRTPDWQATLDDRKVLCEVKTIRTSDDEIKFRVDVGAVRCPDADTGTSWTLSDGLLKQLAGKIGDAESQLKGFDNSAETRRIAFIVINFDDILMGHVDCYFKQIEESLCRNPVSGMSVVCYGKTSFGEGQLTLEWHHSTRCELILRIKTP